MWKLFYPLRYFRLANREKTYLDLVPTLLLAILLWMPFVVLNNVTFFQPNGFLDKILTLASCLTGFYIAALVAAATFAHPDLDKVIRSGSIALVERGVDGNKIQSHLTRREFACAIFGYLSFSALTISLACAFAIGLSGADIPAKIAPYASEIRASISFAYCLMISHLFIATCLGLYYLMDRLYRHDQQIITKKPNINDRFA